jgi:peptidoglycan/xylan/chitin deacetylase (PgdA/CDA1 family)
VSAALILMYHQVDCPRSDKEARFCTPPDEFRRQMAWLRQAGYRGVDLDEMRAHVAGERPLSGKALHVTFDDGFIGVFDHALPALEEHGLLATLFAVSARVGATNDWMAARGFPRRALMSAPQLRLLADSGVAIGSHTRTHSRLPELPAREAEAEIAASRAELEDVLGQPVRHFAYPYGLFNAAVRELVLEAGYATACSTRSGFNRPGEDVFLLRRIDVFGTDRLWQFRQKLRFGTNESSRLRPLAYYGQRVAARLHLS